MTTYNAGEHFGGYVIRLFDAPNIIGDRYKNRNQLRLDMPTRLAEESFLNYVDNYPIIIDPATEYTFYLSELPKWITDKNEAIHRKIRFFVKKVMAAKKRGAETFSKWKNLENWTLWNQDVANSPRLQHDLIGNFYDLELSYGSSSLLAPGPLIKDAYDLKTAIDLNILGCRR